MVSKESDKHTLNSTLYFNFLVSLFFCIQDASIMLALNFQSQSLYTRVLESFEEFCYVTYRLHVAFEGKNNTSLIGNLCKFHDAHIKWIL